MSLELGDVVLSGPSITMTTDGTPTAGDALAIDQSTDKKLTQANSGDAGAGEELAGAAGDSDHGSDGDEERLQLGGAVVMNVASGVVCGNRLAPSATNGQLAASSGGTALALTDAGGEWDGTSLGSNEAVVYLG